MKAIIAIFAVAIFALTGAVGYLWFSLEQEKKRHDEAITEVLNTVSIINENHWHQHDITRDDTNRLYDAVE